MAAGELDQAEAKARQALTMNVVPSLTADRAEAVLNDIAMARAGTEPASPQPAPAAIASASPMPPASSPPVVEPPSVVAEREANELLAKGQNDAAAPLFAEADRLRAIEMAQPPAVDPVGPAGRHGARPGPRSRRRCPGSKPRPAADPGRPDAARRSPAAQPVPDAAPAPIGDPTAPPVGHAGPRRLGPPAAGASSPSLSADAPPAGNKGEELLTQAKALFSGGNYAAAREKAAEAKAGQYGRRRPGRRDARPDRPLRAGGALAVYEAALDALRKNDVERARAMLNEVAASGCCRSTRGCCRRSRTSS